MKKILITAMALILAIAASVDTYAGKKPDHIIVVGFDGWGAYSVPKAEMPNLSELMSKGAWTLKKRSVLPSSSAINWASMFMGVGTEGHGYTQWGSKTPEIPSIVLSENGIFPTIFTITRQQKSKAEIGVLYEWDGIKHLIDTLAVSYHAQVPPTADGSSGPITKAFADYIRQTKPTLALVSYDNPDAVGHRVGHDTPEYYAMLRDMDAKLGQIIDAVKDAGIYDNTVMIVTSDHGGIEKGHGGITLAEMETPFVIAGKGVKPIGEFKSAMMQYDVAATIAALLGLKQPQAWVGRPVTEILN